MFKTLKNAWKVPEMRTKILFTLMIIVLYRIGATVTVPYVDASQVEAMKAIYGNGSFFEYMNILSGGALAQAKLFALSVSPYITAQIVIQLLTIAIPALERLSKNGEEGRKKITKITRYASVALGLLTAYGYYAYMKANGILLSNDWFAAVVIIASYAAGSALTMWMAERIEEYGIGSGVSIILLVNIIAALPSMVSSFIDTATSGWTGPLFAILTVLIAIATVVFIVFITNSERRLQVQYAKKVVGRKMYGGQSTTLPMKLNMSGVMPIIFASSIVSLPATIAIFFPAPKEGSFWDKFLGVFSSESLIYALLLFILIIAFAYFYIAISFNPIEVSNNLKKNGGFIPGIRPGKPTADYITKILNKITLIGAIFLGIIAILPMILNVIAAGKLSSLAFGGSSLIIIVGVILEVYRELESQLTMRHYKGFLE